MITLMLITLMTITLITLIIRVIGAPLFATTIRSLQEMFKDHKTCLYHEASTVIAIHVL